MPIMNVMAAAQLGSIPSLKWSWLWGLIIFYLQELGVGWRGGLLISFEGGILIFIQAMKVGSAKFCQNVRE